jgi:hypothetical protein
MVDKKEKAERLSRDSSFPVNATNMLQTPLSCAHNTKHHTRVSTTSFEAMPAKAKKLPTEAGLETRYCLEGGSVGRKLMDELGFFVVLHYYNCYESNANPSFRAPINCETTHTIYEYDVWPRSGCTLSGLLGRFHFSGYKSLLRLKVRKEWQGPLHLPPFRIQLTDCLRHFMLI